MANLNQYNPFSKRESHGAGSVTTYKVFAVLTWLLSIIVTFYYTLHAPNDGHYARRNVWSQNNHYATAFSLDSVITSIFWIILWILQGGYIASLFSKNTDIVHSAASVGSHFILNNLLHFAFIMLFVRSHFVWAEIMIIINFFNLSSLYYRHNTYARFIHAPVVSGPLAWTVIALFWNGAMTVYHPGNTVARIFGNIFIWVIFAYGMSFVVLYKDYTIGFWFSILFASLGVHQFLAKTIALQWIFAFVIMALFFLSSLGIAAPAWRGASRSTSTGPTGDAERAPLLNEGNN